MGKTPAIIIILFVQEASTMFSVERRPADGEDLRKALKGYPENN